MTETAFLGVLQRPVVTERATRLRAANQYVFRVSLHANKAMVKSAIEQMFKVKVVGVNTMSVRGKFRRRGASGGYRAAWKKAVVAVQPGQEIRFMDEGK